MSIIPILSLIMAVALSNSSVGAESNADPRAISDGPGRYGVVESIGSIPAQNDGSVAAMNSVVGSRPAPGQEVDKGRNVRAPFRIRVRLDDGRYLGFHQDGGEALRVGDRVQIENDRLRRAQEQTKGGN